MGSRNRTPDGGKPKTLLTGWMDALFRTGVVPPARNPRGVVETSRRPVPAFAFPPQFHSGFSELLTPTCELSHSYLVNLVVQ